MIFLTKDDFLAIIELETLDSVIDDDDTKLDAIEPVAIMEMATYLNARFDTDAIFTAEERNALIVMYCCDISLYHIHSRISPDNIPTLRDERYKAAIDWLEKAADGFTAPLLPTKQEPSTMPIRFGSSAPKSDQFY